MLDHSAVAEHATAVAATGDIDICFNATSNDDVQGTAHVDLPFEDFMRPVTKSVTAHFNVATTGARHMMQRRRGVILAMAGGREATPRLGGSHVAWTALAGLCASLPPTTVHTASAPCGCYPPARPTTTAKRAKPPPARCAVVDRPNTRSNIAAFASSDWASTMTATELNFTASAVVD